MISAFGQKAHIVTVVGNTVVFSQNEISIWVYRNKQTVSSIFCFRFCPTCNFAAAIWILRRFLNKWLRKAIQNFFVQHYKKRKRFHILDPPELFILYFENTTWQWLRKKQIQTTTSKTFSSFQFVKLHFYFFQLHALYLDNRNTWFTTLLAPWTS